MKGSMITWMDGLLDRLINDDWDEKWIDDIGMDVSMIG
jgi:hypothetical protein